MCNRNLQLVHGALFLISSTHYNPGVVVWKFSSLACRIPNSSPMWNSFTSFEIKTK